MTIREMLGQKLIFGFQGTTLPDDFVSLIREYKIGNVILFRRNVESAQQLRRLCRQIQELIREVTGHPAFIVIDQEGGMVSRLPEDAVNVPSAMALAALESPSAVTRAGQITARQLRGLGANFNMAPVLDVNNNPGNPVIGIRSYGDRAENVARLGEAAVAAYRDSGVLCCGKHFPGHGDTTVDSHLGIPRVEKTEEELEQLELIPFRRAIAAGIPAMMISHVMFPKIEPEQVPCTMSRKIVTGLLKQKLGFEGLILTDCMEMLAIQDHYGTPQGALAAIAAGVDLAELSNTLELERQTAELLNQAALDGRLDPEEIRLSAEKILRCKAQIDWEPEEALCNLPQDRRSAQEMIRCALTLVSGTPIRGDETTFFCGCGDYRASAVANEEENAHVFPVYMGRSFGGKWAVCSKDPDDGEIRAILEQAAAGEKIVLSTCNGHLFPGQIALGRALAALGKPMTVVALRNPYDLPLLPDGLCKIAACDYSRESLRAVEQVLRGGECPGHCPVAL